MLGGYAASSFFLAADCGWCTIYIQMVALTPPRVRKVRCVLNSSALRCEEGS